MGEAFGIVLLEAMATGRPVVASSLPGVRTVAVERVNGLLAEPGNADDLAAKLRALLDDPLLRARMGAAGRRLVEQQYTWPRIGARLEQLYVAVLAEAKRASGRRPSSARRTAPDAAGATRERGGAG
jgi:glycosyltransferase involved in cell wall biosynthesis